MPRPALPDDTVLNLYVPSESSRLNVAARSAIVGLPRNDADYPGIEIYYEGAVYGQDMDFEGKIQIAAGRMLHRAPTTAFGFHRAKDLILVATVARSERLRGWIVTDVTDRNALETWAGEPVAVGGSAALKARAAGIAWGRLSPARQMDLQVRAGAGADLAEMVLDTI